MKRKIEILLITLFILLASVSTSYAATGNKKIDWLIENGLVTGDSNGYRLYDYITRAETTKMVVEAAGLGEYVDGYKYLVSMFKDMNQNNWANGYVNVAVINTLVNGYPDGTFGPSNNITYAEVIKMLVMANGDTPDTSSYSGSLWAIPYIVKAAEVGITQDVQISDYYKPATREKVFEMVFNTMFKEEPTVLEEYNGIIMENERVSKLDEDEISLIIFQDLNRSSEVESRYKRNQKIELILPREVEDVEYLMGKVVDITIDNNNVVQELSVDTSYSYLEGPILAFEDEIYLGTNGEYYRVDDGLQVYHNDEDYEYIDYVEELGERDSEDILSFLAEYANLTVKGGRVYYLDSFTFTDIAPVSKVSRNGDEILIYDDSNDATLKSVSVNDVISYTYDWGFETLELKKIREGDILHIYDKDRAIVRKDSIESGQLKEIYEYMEYYFADIDGDSYQVRVTDARRPVYSKDGVDFKTIYAEDLDYDVISLFDEKVIYLLDINGHIQSIKGGKLNE